MEKVSEYWREKLTLHVQKLTSLKYLKTEFISLRKCHPIYTTCGLNTHEIEKAVTQGRLLSGRVKFERLARHFTTNTAGLCSLSSFWGTSLAHVGDIEHFLLSCPSLEIKRAYLRSQIQNFYIDHPELSDLIRECLDSDPVQFLLDCSVMQQVILCVQLLGEEVIAYLFKLTRHYCYCL